MLSFLFCLMFSIFFVFLNEYMFFSCIMLMTPLILFFKVYSGFMVNISFIGGLDILSFWMMMLTFYVNSLSGLSMFYILESFNFFLFMFSISSMSLFLIFFFYTLNMVFFFCSFEIVMIPMFFLILGWGYKVERLKAGLYLLFYTMFASFPFLFLIFRMKMNFFSSFMLLEVTPIKSFIYFFFMFFAFLVKMPMFLVHYWLPKAHVEAPVAGSMILAGILLKLGGYGIIRFVKFVLVSFFFNSYIFSISLWGGMLVGFFCLRQLDIKSMIAFSSVSHMSLVIMGLYSLSFWGLSFSIMMMVAHGLCSSALFFISNVLYKRIFCRSFLMNKGILNISPSMSMWWFLLSCCNMGSPPSLNLISEIGLINSIISWCMLGLLFIMFISFLSAVFSLYLFSYTQHGESFSGLAFKMSPYCSEFLIIFLHWFPLNFFFFNLSFFS